MVASNAGRLVALLLVASVIGCDSKPPSSTPSAPTAATPTGGASGRILPREGGSVGDAAGASVTVPPGAVDREVRLQLAPKPAGDFKSAGIRVAGQVWTFDVDGREHFKFAKPVRLAIPIDPSLLAKDSPVGLSVWEEGEWRPVPGARVEADFRRIVAEVDHFSSFAPTQPVRESSLEQERKRFLENEFWYGSVHFTIHGSGQSGPGSGYTLSREANIKFRVRADPNELAMFAGADQLKKRGVTLPGDGEAYLEQLRNIRVWSLAGTNRAPEDDVEFDWTVNDRWDDPLTARTVTGQYAGKIAADPKVLPKLFIDVSKGTYSIAFGIQAGTITSTELQKGKTAVPKTAPGQVTWIRQGNLPTGGNVLTGQICGPKLDANVGDGGVWTFNYGSVRTTMTWTLSPVPLEEVELVLVPDPGYDDWMPKGGKDEKVAGATTGLTAALRHRGGGRTTATMTELTVRLSDVSSEPGVCLNSPREGAAASPDLKFAPADGASIDEEGARLRKKGGKFSEFKVTIDCYDWGAWGAVKAEAWLSDGRPVWATLDGDRSEPELRLPKRDSTSKVADAWKKKMNVEGRRDDEDADAQPAGDGFAGDGLSLYEEYRGFVIENENRAPDHVRTDPLRKDYFVCVKLPDPKKGLREVERLSGLQVHRVPEENHQERVINFNVSPRVKQRCKQHLVLLTLKSAVDAVMIGAWAGGETVLLPGSASARVTPKSVERVWVAPSTGASQKVVVKFDNGKLGEGAEEDPFVIAIAHELLHAVGVAHHGPLPTRVTWTREGTRVLENGKPVAIHLEGSAAPITMGEYDAILERETVFNLAATGDAYSGDQACIMRYAGAPAVKRGDRRILFPGDARDSWGMELCTEKKGTGVNAPPLSRYGNATVGVCTKQIRVSDAGR